MRRVTKNVMTRAFSSQAGGSFHGKREGAIANLFIENPERKNAMNLSMYDQIPGVVDSVVKDGVRVVVLQGAGNDAFGAGSDISEFPHNRHNATEAAKYSAVENRASESLLSIKPPLLAKIRGPCIGGGLNLALTADIRYASDDAIFCVPPAKLGIGYPQELMDLLLSAVGRSSAKDLVFTARAIKAEEALRIGLVDAVVPGDQLDAYVDKVAEGISRLAPITVEAAKLSANRDPRGRQRCSDCYESSDYKEGVTAFVEKRHATFKGQ
jgi:enoyl-CoA hydratase|eukprot:g1934.t1